MQHHYHPHQKHRGEGISTSIQKIGLLLLLLLLYILVIHPPSLVGASAATPNNNNNAHKVDNSSSSLSDVVTIASLTTEYLECPLGVDTSNPRLSWKLLHSTFSKHNNNRRHRRGSGVSQTSYQIQISSQDSFSFVGVRDATKELQRSRNLDANEVFWECRPVESSESILVPLFGNCHSTTPTSKEEEDEHDLILVSDTWYYWRVIVTLQNGSQITSDSSCFHTGFLVADPPDNGWQAEWITGGNTNTLLRSEFEVPPLSSWKSSTATTTSSSTRKNHATLFISGIGYHEVYLNGMKIGNHQLDQGWTDYAKRVWYSTHDVTDMLLWQVGQESATTGVPKKHVIGVMLGNGWYSCGVSPGTGNPVCEDSPPRLLLQLQVNGLPILVSSSNPDPPLGHGGWYVAPGPILYNSLYNGEIYDARVAETLQGWTSPGFEDASSWTLATHATSSVVNGDAPSSQLFEPIRHISSRHPISVTSPSTGVQVFDFGQNHAAVVRLKNFHCDRGTNVTLRHAETLTHPPYGPLDGGIYVANLRKAHPIDIYICNGNTNGESYTPTFTQHGFRYVEISGLGYPLNEVDVEALELHTDVRQTSSLLFSNPLLNQIQHLVVWSQKTNLMSVPTDCDNRDERRGWMGDTALTAEEAAYNFGMGAFYTHWLTQIVDSQAEDGSVPNFVPALGESHGAPNWQSAYPVVIWVLMTYYGDMNVIVRHHDTLVRYYDYFEMSYHQTGLQNFITGFGDWVPPPPHNMAEKHLTGAFAFLHDLQLGIELFSLSSHPDAPAQAHRCGTLKQKLTKEYHDAFYNTTTNVYMSGLQAEQVFPLTVGAVPDELVPDILSYLVKDIQVTNEGHTTCGIIGIKFLLETLSSHGYSDVALDLALQTTYPSWGYMIQNENEPATTLWELWNTDTAGPAMNSRNHVMFGSVSSWFYKYLAGITPLTPGYAKISIKPTSAGHSNLTHVDARVVTPHGDLLSSWSVDKKGGVLTYTHSLSLPSNTYTVLAIPLTLSSNHQLPNTADSVTISEGGVPVWENGVFVPGISGVESGKLVDQTIEFGLTNGRFVFTAVFPVGNIKETLSSSKRRIHYR